MSLPILRLNSKADHRLRNGHLWVYSNEIDNKFNHVTNLQPGDCAIIESASGKFLGVAYINPNTLICGRIINSLSPTALDQNMIMQRIQNALKLRDQIFNSGCYRLIYGESDFLPGLVVDRFYDVLVVQIATAGMERFKDEIIAALDQCIKPKSILVKNDGKMREVEGLTTYVEWVKGEATDALPLEENGVKFIAPLASGQKTGWFYDHRMMRARLANYVAGKRVLDMFSYIGGWGIQAGAFGAKEIIFNDSSADALNGVKENAKLNNLQNISTLQGDAFDVMDTLNKDNEKFDVIVLDPPAFIPRRKDLHKGIAAYQKANLQAMKLLNPNGGILVSGSCSMHLPAEELQSAIQRAGAKLARNVQILEQGHQGPDHPIHPSIPETKYLKSFIARVLE